ncbi:hypothetical protein AMECASPLE_027271 [Ameca splendens]|uniref:Uncharacterized protein n=1 Tax=Ameca splendens TaxID=208324 RepID=A0ABV0YGB2_9TELE
MLSMVVSHSSFVSESCHSAAITYLESTPHLQARLEPLPLSHLLPADKVNLRLSSYPNITFSPSSSELTYYSSFREPVTSCLPSKQFKTVFLILSGFPACGSKKYLPP